MEFNCIAERRIPEDPAYKVDEETSTPRLVSYAIAMALPGMVASAINQNSGQHSVIARQVRVDLGTTSRWAQNGSDVQIVVRPGRGGLEDSAAQRDRRTGIVLALVRELRDLMQESPN